jgi:hypothetical protein
MKRCWAFLLILIFVQANTALGEFVKTPMLVHHFMAHSKEYSNHNFIRFLAEHYSDQKPHQHHEKHANEHDQLPFKTIENNASSHFSVDTPVQFQFNKQILLLGAANTPQYSPLHYNNAYLDRIWQPPKMA